MALHQPPSLRCDIPDETTEPLTRPIHDPFWEHTKYPYKESVDEKAEPIFHPGVTGRPHPAGARCAECVAPR